MARQRMRAEGRRASGMPVSVKFALVTGGIVAVFMLGFGLFLRGFIRDAVHRQVLQAAWESAYVGAQADLDAWTSFFGTEFQGLTVEQLNAKVQEEGWTPKDYERRYQNEAVMQRLEWNKARFRRAVLPGIRIVALELLDKTEPGNIRLLGQSYEGDLDFTPLVATAPVQIPSGDVREGFMPIAGVPRHVIRASHPVGRLDDARTGELAVYLDARIVDEATGALMLRVIYSAIGFVIIGAGLAWFVGRTLMRPLVKLQEDIRVVAGGDLAHRTSVRSGDEIGELARTFDVMTESLQQAQERERETAGSRHQMSLAAEVAASLVPASLPALPGYEIAGHHAAGGQLGGETYDVLRLPGGRLGLIVSSASGTGVPAAMVMAMARSSLAAVASTEADPGEILRRVNNLLSGDLRRGMYVTVLLAVLDPSSGTLSLANAGHAPLLFSRGQALKVVHSEGIALGFDKGPVFDRTLKVLRVPLQPGDRVVLYGPGVTRVNGEGGAPLGEERFAALVKREAGHPAPVFVKRMAALVAKFRGEAPCNEDVTLLALSRQDEGGGRAGGEA